MADDKATSQKAARGRLIPTRLQGSRERLSGAGVFPAIPETSPSAARYEPLILSEQATLYSYTIIHPNPKLGEPTFILAYADFPEQVRVFGRLLLPAGSRPQIGMRLRVVSPEIQEESPEVDPYAFVPAEEAAA